jgi:hypothetical protein
MGLRKHLLFIGIFCLSVSGLISAKGNNLDCSIGALSQTYGGSEWVVHACSDGKSVVIVSDEGNPANPFVFFIIWTEEDFTLYGEGTGEKSSTKPAFDELSSLLSDEFVQNLYTEVTKTQK